MSSDHYSTLLYSFDTLPVIAACLLDFVGIPGSYGEDR